MQTLSYANLLQNITLFNFGGGNHTFFFVLNDIKMMACEFDLKNVKAAFLLYQVL